jgi:hypothetical protein
MTADEMREELYGRARTYLAEGHPEYDPASIVMHARNAVDAMVNSHIAAGVDETAALEYAIKQDIKKLVTVVVT